MVSRRGRVTTRGVALGWIVPALAAVLLWAAPANGQQVLSQATGTIQVEIGKGALVTLPAPVSRLAVADTTIADFQFPGGPNEMMVRGLRLGTTSLIVWEQTGARRIYNIEVVPDLTALRTQIRTLFPSESITVTLTGSSIILSGAVSDPITARRIRELAEATGVAVIDNIQAPAAQQVLLHVRFAEVRRSAVDRLAADLFGTDVGNIGDVVGSGATADVTTLSEGIVNLLLAGGTARLDAAIRALRSSGEFRSLAEPNLITIDGQEATFLAGGEFPYPIVQPGAQTTAVSIAFKEFGVRLRFTPTITNTGAIRLKVAPEVSSLDFANGLTVSGFQIPSLLARRAETEVEMRPGQHLAIAGLLDNTWSENLDKIPFLGDLPIIGTFFRARSNLQDRTELLVLITPHIVAPSDTSPTLPMGEPGTWGWMRNMRERMDQNWTMPHVRRN